MLLRWSIGGRRHTASLVTTSKSAVLKTSPPTVVTEIGPAAAPVGTTRPSGVWTYQRPGRGRIHAVRHVGEWGELDEPAHRVHLVPDQPGPRDRHDGSHHAACRREGRDRGRTLTRTGRRGELGTSSPTPTPMPATCRQKPSPFRVMTRFSPSVTSLVFALRLHASSRPNLGTRARANQSRTRVTTGGEERLHQPSRSTFRIDRPGVWAPPAGSDSPCPQRPLGRRPTRWPFCAAARRRLSSAQPQLVEFNLERAVRGVELEADVAISMNATRSDADSPTDRPYLRGRHDARCRVAVRRPGERDGRAASVHRSTKDIPARPGSIGIGG
jgi:hypothetical protein